MVVLLLPVALFLLIQILLATPWAKGELCKRLGKRLGTEVSIDALSWTPWSGFRLVGLEVAAPPGLDSPKPVLEVDSIRVWPDYAALATGDVAIRGVDVDRPELHLSVELLILLMGTDTAPPTPPLAVVQRVPGPMPAVPPAPAGPGASAPPPVAGENKPAPEVPEAGSEPVVASANPTPERSPIWVTISKGRGDISEGGSDESLVSFQDIELVLPVGGSGEGFGSTAIVIDKNESFQTIVNFGVRAETQGLHFSYLRELGNHSQISGGLSVKLEHGLPFMAGISIRSPESKKWSDAEPLKASTGSFEGLIQAGGWGTSPSSWSGLARLAGSDLVMSTSSMTARFDRVNGSFLLRQGMLQCPDLRLIGDQVSVLGNGWANREGAAAVTRVVIPCSARDLVAGRIGRGEHAVGFGSLGAGDRCFTDLSAWWTPEGVELELGNGGSVVPLADLLEAR